jgi:hypothetical protein
VKSLRRSLASRAAPAGKTFAAALAELGEQGLADRTGCLGNFSMLARLLNAFLV